MINIAIDGPSGAGKSTLAKLLAEKLGYIYVDTGALYRAIGYFVLENGADPNDEKTVISMLYRIDIQIVHCNGIQRILLCGRDVTDKIRSEEVSMAASYVSAIAEVRAFLLDLQRDLAKENNVIMDGRDIGTVVLPNATVKIFLSASDEERAERRVKQLNKNGIDAKYDEVLRDMQKRDYNDSHRAAAPLKPADDAFFLDTTGQSLDQSVDQIMSLVKKYIDN